MRPATILFVEDEPVIALFVQSSLEDHGHRVLCAERSDEALAICAQQLPDLVLLNCRQAGSLSGAELACLLYQQFKLPVLLVTGARTQDLPAMAWLDAGCRVLHKPFTPRQLDVFVNRGLQDLK
ncbi:MAG: response regulator [Saprospiraceae bacterium]|nr:response regulator [Saprospiraceae bacterium]